MKRIAILSDTHSFIDERVENYLHGCDEIWHAGDIGSMEVVNRLSNIAPLRAVCGNCDGGEMRKLYPEVLRWKCEDVDVLMKHIGGYPGRYDRSIVRSLMSRPPMLFVSGHSHILKVQYDSTISTLHINPGAAGLQGWHQVRTLIRLTIDGSQMRDLEVIEIPR